MKKLALLLPLLVACSKRQPPNIAEIMVTSQVKGATCRAPESVAVCTMPDKSEVLSIKDRDLPWKALSYVAAPEAPPATPAPGAGSGAAAPTTQTPPAKK
jgi:hypothetical protein